MSNANFTMTGSKTVGLQGIEIRADFKSDALEAIRVAKGWLRASGFVFKVVYFHRTTSQYSNLVTYFHARIVYKAAA